MTRDQLLEFDPLDRKFDPKITACASFTCLQRGCSYYKKIQAFQDFLVQNAWGSLDFSWSVFLNDLMAVPWLGTCCLNLTHWIANLTQRITACASFACLQRGKILTNWSFPHHQTCQDIMLTIVVKSLIYDRENIILVFIACWLFSSFYTIFKEINYCKTVLHRLYWQLINSIGAFGSK